MTPEQYSGLLSSPLAVGASLLVLGIVPFALLSVTSFIKLHIVFNILKNALGAQQVPSGTVTSLLAFVLTLYIMAPVAKQTITEFHSHETATPHNSKIKAPGSPDRSDWVFFFEKASRSSEPLLNFLTLNSKQRERAFFLQASKGQGREEIEVDSLFQHCDEDSHKHSSVCRISGEGFFSLIPAFVISEIREAFALGFLLFLPFLVVDLVVANLLVGVGMSMVTPATVSLPLKLILFVLCDGWFLLCRSLVLGYQ